MSEILQVKVREEIGSNAVKRVRRAGYVPAVLYGHQQANVSLSVPADQLLAAIRHGSKIVELQGGVNDTALINDIEWDSLGVDVLHIDLTRVSATEKIQVTIPIELRGEAPGAREGGMVEHLVHEIEIECSASSLPDKIEISINSLHIEDEIKVGDIKLPEGVELLSDPDEMVVHCVPVTAVPEEEEAGVAEPGEPEVIGRKAEEEEGEED